MQGNLVIILFAAVATVTDAGGLTPNITVDHGAVDIGWKGVRGTFGLGKMITGNKPDGGIILKIDIPDMVRAIVLMDSGFNTRQNFWHMVVGVETKSDKGMAVGIGGEYGSMDNYGVFAVASNGTNSKPTFVKSGNYARVLLQAHKHFLHIIDKVYTY